MANSWNFPDFSQLLAKKELPPKKADSKARAPDVPKVRKEKKTKPVEEYQIGDDDIFSLCNLKFQNQIYTLLLGCWADEKPADYLAELAGFMADYIIAPLNKWEQRIIEGPRGLDAREHYETQQFRLCAVVLAQSLERGGNIEKELADELKYKWDAFIVKFSAHRVHHDLPAELEKKKKVSARNSKNASGEKGTIDAADEKTSMRKIVEKLADRKDALDKDIPPADLWDELYDELGKIGITPTEEHPKDRKQRKYLSPDLLGGEYKFSSFKTEISEARKK
ncbi:MAG: hypothetical protein Q8P42_06060 [Gallionella sp.]|nr:hypothetical protein [Gallionella sp.]